MKVSHFIFGASLLVISSANVLAQQTVPGAGNARAVEIANTSAEVQSAYKFVISQTKLIQDDYLRDQTLDALSNPKTCIRHRANLNDAQRKAIVQQLLAAGLLNPGDDASFPGGLLAGVFPPVLKDNTACPQLPQPFFSAPGSGFPGGHHSYPGGLPVHESNNDTAHVNLANEYRNVYGHSGHSEFPTVNKEAIQHGVGDLHVDGDDSDIFVDEDIILGAPLWHDWAKSIVFQWNADGSEFQELHIGGTGGHHIMSIAETMSRGLAPDFVVTVACAHNTPTEGNEGQVAGWLRAAAIIAQIDPIKQGYLTLDSQGNYRLPAVRDLGQVDLIAAGSMNVLPEYVMHFLSDQDWVFAEPAIGNASILLAKLAPEFGYDPADTANYNNHFRNVVLSNFTAERLYIQYDKDGIGPVRAAIKQLREKGLL
jgi:hypothetical protein